ncbi:MAG: hypothetical protein ACM3U2_17995, partial [Deltaproteobacteria bacterium]
MRPNAGAGKLDINPIAVIFRLDATFLMPDFRNILAWLVLTSYVFANTFAAALHDHRHCCGHSEGV